MSEGPLRAGAAHRAVEGGAWPRGPREPAARLRTGAGADLAAKVCLTLGAAGHLLDGFDGPAELLVEAASALLLLAGCLLALTVALFRARGAGPAVAALALLVAGASGLATQVYPALSRGLADQFGADEDGPETGVTLGPRGRDIRLAGTLTAGAGARLAALLAENPQVERIHLTSDGGLVDEGLALGRAIAAHHLTTYVPDYCVSACTLAFLRGRERLIASDARLGFHAPYETGVFGETLAVDSAPERRAYLDAGLAADFVDAVLRVAAKDIWTPSAERLRAAGAITEIVEPDRLPDSTLDDDPTLAGARAAVLRAVPVLAPLAARAPQSLDAVAQDYLAAYRQGRSEADGLDLIRREAGRQVAAILAGGSDAVVIDLGRFLLAATRAAAADEAEECLAIAQDADLPAAAEILGRGDPHAADTAGGLITRALDDGGASASPRRSRRGRAAAILPLACAAQSEALARALARPDAADRLRAHLFPGSAAVAAAREVAAMPRE
ncbi:hypothetical protein [Methylobacterium sp. JK268]